MNCWLLVYPRRLQDVTKNLVALLRSACGPIGMQVNQPALVELKDERLETYVRTIRSILGNEVGVLSWGGFAAVRSHLWAAVLFPRRTKCSCCCASPPAPKQTCTAPSRSCAACTARCPPRCGGGDGRPPELGWVWGSPPTSALPPQVINAHSLLGHSAKLKSIVQKVLLQMNCKLGGELWGVDVPLVSDARGVGGLLPSGPEVGTALTPHPATLPCAEAADGGRDGCEPRQRDALRHRLRGQHQSVRAAGLCRPAWLNASPLLRRARLCFSLVMCRAGAVQGWGCAVQCSAGAVQCRAVLCIAVLGQGGVLAVPPLVPLLTPPCPQGAHQVVFPRRVPAAPAGDR